MGVFRCKSVTFSQSVVETTKYTNNTENYYANALAPPRISCNTCVSWFHSFARFFPCSEFLGLAKSAAAHIVQY